MFTPADKLNFIRAWAGELNYAKSQTTGDIMFFERREESKLAFLLPPEFSRHDWATWHRVDGFLQIGEKSTQASKVPVGKARKFRIIQKRELKFAS